MGVRGRGRRLAQSTAFLVEMGYLAAERAAIREFDGGEPRDDAQRAAWREIDALLDGPLPGGHAAARGATEHWRPPPPATYGELDL